MAVRRGTGPAGAGIGFALPAALSVFPSLAAATRRGMAIALGGLSQNLTVVVVPPLSLIVLDAFGLAGVAVFVLVSLAVAIAVTLERHFPVSAPARQSGGGRIRGRVRFTFRRDWIGPLAITLLFSAHWGLVVAYLPQRAEAVGASIGLFFAADGLGVLFARLPTGWLADRIPPQRLLVAGVLITAVGVALLLLVPTTPLLVVAGLLTGSGAACITTPVLVALSRRSTDNDRGSAFALFSAVFAVALAIGSVGAAAVIDGLGFELTLTGLLGALLLAGVVALLDRGLATVLPGIADSAEVELTPVQPAS